MLSPLETGTTLGADPGNVEGAGKPGSSHGCLAPAVGTWRQQSQATGGPGVAMPGKAPHLIRGGPCLILPGRNIFFQDRHADDRQNASRDDPGHGREQRRGPHAAAPRPEAAGAKAAVADGQTQDGGERPRPGSCTISSAPGPEPRVRPAGCLTAGVGALIGCCLPARPAGCFTRSLCTKMWMTCAQQR
jgi:hypothetical protein